MLFTRNNLKLIFCFLTIASLCGCGKRGVFVDSSTKYDFCENQENVTLNIRRVKHGDKTQISHKSLLDKYIPLELKIENLSYTSFILKSDKIDQKIITPTEIENNKSTILNLYKFITNSAFIMIWLLLCIIMLLAYLFFYHKIILLFIPLSFIGLNILNNGIIDFFQKKNAQKHAVGFLLKAATKIEIPANSAIQKIIFIEKENFKPSFEVTIEDINNHKHSIKFEINLK